MRISELRHVVYIQTPTTSQDSRGAESVTWANSVPLRARIRTVSGDERQRAEQITPINAHEVLLRWPLPRSVALTVKSRLRWDDGGTSRYFGITAIGEPDNRGRLVVLTCEEIVDTERVL